MQVVVLRKQVESGSGTKETGRSLDQWKREGVLRSHLRCSRRRGEQKDENF